MAIKRQRPPRPGEILNFLGHRRLKATPENGKSGPQVRVAPSPCCGNDKRGGSLVINTATGLWNCWACSKKGNWLSFTRLSGYPIEDAYEEAARVDFSVYEKVRAMLRRPASAGHHPALLAYVKTRGIRPGTLDAWRVSTCGPEALRWPLFAIDEAGNQRIANARIRKVLNRDKATGTADWFEVKGGPTSLAMGNHLLGQNPADKGADIVQDLSAWLGPPETQPEIAGDPGLQTRLRDRTYKIKRVLIVEGQWDAMTAWQLGIPNVLSLPNGAAHVDVSGLLRYVPEGAEVWLAVDMDPAGDKAAEAFFAQLGGDAARLYLPHKDLNAWFLAKPDLTAEDVFATVGGQAESGDEDFVVIRERPVLEVRSQVICTAPWELLTKRLGGGFRAGETSGLLAPSGYGKTTFCNMLVANAAKEAVKVGVIQLEGLWSKVQSDIYDAVVGWSGYEEPADVKQAVDGMMPFVLLSRLTGKDTTWQETIEAAEKMMRVGAKLVIVDNWDYITGTDVTGGKAKATAYGKFQELCKRYLAHGFVVWQPNKIDRDVRVNSGNQKGMSTALQDADIYMTLNKSGTARLIEVEKVRGVAEVEGMSSQIWLRYDGKRKILFQSESQATLSVPEYDGFDKL